MAETLGLITNRRYTKDGFRPGSSSRISTHQGWPESGSLPRFLEVFLGSITRGRGHGRDDFPLPPDQTQSNVVARGSAKLQSDRLLGRPFF